MQSKFGPLPPKKVRKSFYVIMMSALAAFLVVALLPTALALWFIRGHQKF